MFRSACLNLNKGNYVRLRLDVAVLNLISDVAGKKLRTSCKCVDCRSRPVMRCRDNVNGHGDGGILSVLHREGDLWTGKWPDNSVAVRLASSHVRQCRCHKEIYSKLCLGT